MATITTPTAAPTATDKAKRMEAVKAILAREATKPPPNPDAFIENKKVLTRLGLLSELAPFCAKPGADRPWLEGVLVTDGWAWASCGATAARLSSVGSDKALPDGIYYMQRLEDGKWKIGNVDADTSIYRTSPNGIFKSIIDGPWFGLATLTMLSLCEIAIGSALPGEYPVIKLVAANGMISGLAERGWPGGVKFEPLSGGFVLGGAEPAASRAEFAGRFDARRLRNAVAGCGPVALISSRRERFSPMAIKRADGRLHLEMTLRDQVP